MPGTGWDLLLGMGFGESIGLNHSLGSPGALALGQAFPRGSVHGCCGNRGGKGSSSRRAGRCWDVLPAELERPSHAAYGGCRWQWRFFPKSGENLPGVILKRCIL